MAQFTERIAALEAQVNSDPESRDLREELVSLYVQARLTDSAQRYEHVRWYVRHHPRQPFARCPLALIDCHAAPAAYAAVEALWVRHFEENPADVQIACGLAGFVAQDDLPRALSILEEFVRLNPAATEAWLDLGRMHPEPSKSLAMFREARERGSQHPNLLVWIARSAIDADDRPVAERTGHELLGLVAGARSAYGDRLDWSERGRDLWKRARQSTASNAEASDLVNAISAHAFHKHWAHTTLGITSVRNGDLTSAVAHLHQSAAIPGDFRLSSYGPSFQLADALCRLGQWAAVVDYLEACKAFWNPQHLEALQDEVKHQRIPSFPDA